MKQELRREMKAKDTTLGFIKIGMIYKESAENGWDHLAMSEDREVQRFRIEPRALQLEAQK